MAASASRLPEAKVCCRSLWELGAWAGRGPAVGGGGTGWGAGCPHKVGQTPQGAEGEVVGLGNLEGHESSQALVGLGVPEGATTTLGSLRGCGTPRCAGKAARWYGGAAGRVGGQHASPQYGCSGCDVHHLLVVLTGVHHPDTGPWGVHRPAACPEGAACIPRCGSRAARWDDPLPPVSGHFGARFGGCCHCRQACACSEHGASGSVRPPRSSLPRRVRSCSPWKLAARTETERG